MLSTLNFEYDIKKMIFSRFHKINDDFPRTAFFIRKKTNFARLYEVVEVPSVYRRIFCLNAFFYSSRIISFMFHKETTLVDFKIF